MTIIAGSPNVVMNPTDDYVTQFGWQPVGSISDIQAKLATSGLADAAVEALADALKAQFKPVNGTVALEFRFYSDGAAADEAATVEVYAAAGVDYYRHIATLTVTIGTAQKASATVLWADGIAETKAMWITTTKAVHENANSIGSWTMNVHGYDRILFIASAATMDLDPAVPGTPDDELFIEARRY